MGAILTKIAPEQNTLMEVAEEEEVASKVEREKLSWYEELRLIMT